MIPDCFFLHVSPIPPAIPANTTLNVFSSGKTIFYSLFSPHNSSLMGNRRSIPHQTRQVLVFICSFNTRYPEDRAIEQPLSGYIILSESYYLSLYFVFSFHLACSMLIVYTWGFPLGSLLFNIFPHTYCATASYYFLAVGTKFIARRALPSWLDTTSTHYFTSSNSYYCSHCKLLSG